MLRAMTMRSMADGLRGNSPLYYRKGLAWWREASSGFMVSIGSRTGNVGTDSIPHW